MKFRLYYMSRRKIENVEFHADSIKEMKQKVDDILIVNKAMYIGCEYIGS